MGLVVWMSSREGGLALVFGGITFIVCLMLLAMLALTARPDSEERNDIDQQNRDAPTEEGSALQVVDELRREPDVARRGERRETCLRVVADVEPAHEVHEFRLTRPGDPA